MMTLKIRTQIFILAGLMFLSGSSLVLANETDALGTWVGTMTDKPPSAITLTVKSVQVGEKGASIRIGAPKSCNLDDEVVSFENDEAVFSLSKSSGGYCDKFLRGTMSVKFNTEKKTADYELKSASGKSKVTGSLKKK